MKVIDGEINITLKTIYWIGLPENLSRDDQINILKKDMLIVPWNPLFSTYYQLAQTNNPRTVYFFNVDYITRENGIEKDQREAFADSFSAFIHTHFPGRCLVYSNDTSENKSAFYTRYNILYRNPCFSGKHDLHNVLIETTNILCAKNKKNKAGTHAPRSSFRLSLLPLKYEMEVIVPDNKTPRTYTGYINDMSLSGVGCLLIDPLTSGPDSSGTSGSGTSGSGSTGSGNTRSGFLRINTPLQIRMYLHKTIVVINKCILSRICSHGKELGVSFDINDKEAISESDGNLLSSLMYTWLNQVIRQYRQE